MARAHAATRAGGHTRSSQQQQRWRRREHSGVARAPHASQGCPRAAQCWSSSACHRECRAVRKHCRSQCCQHSTSSSQGSASSSSPSAAVLASSPVAAVLAISHVEAACSPLLAQQFALSKGVGQKHRPLHTPESAHVTTWPRAEQLERSARRAARRHETRQALRSEHRRGGRRAVASPTAPWSGAHPTPRLRPARRAGDKHTDRACAPRTNTRTPPNGARRSRPHMPRWGSTTQTHPPRSALRAADRRRVHIRGHLPP